MRILLILLIFNLISCTWTHPKIVREYHIAIYVTGDNSIVKFDPQVLADLAKFAEVETTTETEADIAGELDLGPLP